jgi:inner membrane transporter RhtA
VSDQQGIGVGAAVGSVLIIQIGASFAKVLIEDLPGPAAATWLRLATASVVLGVVVLVKHLFRKPASHPGNDGLGTFSETSSGKPLTSVASPTSTSVARRPRKAWGLAVAWSVALVTMNFCIYEAFHRIPVGIAVTIEYLGPLGVAIAGSRKRIDLLWALLAGTGVVLLGFRPTPLNLVGVAFVLGAALSWIGYITLGAKIGQYFQNTNVLAAACAGGALVLLGPTAATGTFGVLDWRILGLGALVGLSCTVIPYSLDLYSLGKIRPATFAILNSLAPAVAAIGAWALLRQSLAATDWVAVCLVVVASIGATARRSS